MKTSSEKNVNKIVG